MREDELRKAAKCSICGKPFGHTGLPLFWRITIERFGVDLKAIQRQDGLAMMLGSSVLANAMGIDAEMTKTIIEPTTMTVCEACIFERDTLGILIEKIGG